MKIVVTGSNGLTGQKLITILKKKAEVDLIATSRTPDKYFDPKGYTFECLDITDKTACDYIISKYNPDVLINAAVQGNVDICEENKSEAWKQNVEAVINLTHSCNTNNVHFIHLSTDFVFDGLTGMYSENDIPEPVSYYGYTKLEGEKYLIENSKSWSIVRTVLVYGHNQNMTRSNIALWVKNSLEQGKPIKVVSDQYRTPTLAEDLAEGCYQIASKGLSGVYHISGPQYLSVYEIANIVAEEFGLDKSLISPISSISLNQIGKRPPKTGFDISKARNDLNYDPHDLRSGLKILKEQLT